MVGPVHQPSGGPGLTKNFSLRRRLIGGNKIKQRGLIGGPGDLYTWQINTQVVSGTAAKRCC